jgi:hypothetical protein
MPMQRAAYPQNWELVSAFVRHVRARGQCECTGECYGHVRDGSILPNYLTTWGHKERCVELNHQPGRFMRGRVILTTAHLCTCYPLCSTTDHLKAMCQGCHLRFDRYHHARNRRLHRYQAASVSPPLDPQKKKTPSPTPLL